MGYLDVTLNRSLSRSFHLAFSPFDPINGSLNKLNKQHPVWEVIGTRRLWIFFCKKGSIYFLCLLVLQQSGGFGLILKSYRHEVLKLEPMRLAYFDFFWMFETSPWESFWVFTTEEFQGIQMGIENLDMLSIYPFFWQSFQFTCCYHTKELLNIDLLSPYQRRPLFNSAKSIYFLIIVNFLENCQLVWSLVNL